MPTTTKKTTAKKTTTKKTTAKKPAAKKSNIEPKIITSGSISGQNQNSPAFPVSIIIAIIIALGAIYYSVNQNNKAETSNNASNDNIGNFEVKDTGLDQNQQIKTVADVENVVAKWIEANPEAVLNSIIKMQQKAAQEQQKAAQETISSKKKEIFNSNDDPVIKPKGYDIEVVEFFDYNCGYCKRAEKTVSELLKTDKKVKFVFKEYPILGPGSEDLSKIALAVNIASPKNYVAFHNALMKSKARNKDAALKLAATIPGINISKIKEVLEKQKSKIQAKIDANRKLGSSIGVNGTPAFIIGEELIPGAVGIDAIREIIKTQRANK